MLGAIFVHDLNQYLICEESAYGTNVSLITLIRVLLARAKGAYEALFYMVRVAVTLKHVTHDVLEKRKVY